MTTATARIRKAAEFIEQNWQQELPLRTLSRESGLSPFHFQRSFKAILGVTPRQYVEACRLRALKSGLREGNDVLRSIFDAGFGSTSRVYERVGTRLGMTPSAYRAGGQRIQITCVSVRTPLGLLMIGATDRGLCFVQFGESEGELMAVLRQEYPAAELANVTEPWPDPLHVWVQALQDHLEASLLRTCSRHPRHRAVPNARVAISPIDPARRSSFL